MFDPAQTLTLPLPPLDPFLVMVFRLALYLAGGFAIGLVLACLGCALAHCWRSEPPETVSRALVGLVLLLATGVIGVSTATAQEIRGRETGARESVPEVQPRLERLFWADSLRLWGTLFGRADDVSLSPDGRWIALSAFEGKDRVNLWLASVSSGEAVQLSHGQHIDQGPVWFPDGRAIAFSSTRPSDPAPETFALLRMSVSPERGTPSGPPVRLSLEPATEFAISPDGQAIAYAGGGALKVVPATGGAVRTVLSMGTILMPRWGPEGRFLYFFGMDGGTREWAVRRVPVDGGEVETLSTWDPPPWISLGPRGRYLLRELPSEEVGPARYEIASVEGEPQLRFELPKEYVITGFADGPTRLMAAREDIVNPLRVLPVFGGPIRQLNDQWGYDIPLGWSPDGTEILFRTELNGEKIFMFARVDGGTMRQLAVPETMHPDTWPILSGDGAHVLFMTRGEAEDEHRLWVYDIAQDSARLVDDGVPGYQRSGGLGLAGASVGSIPFRTDEGFGYWVTRDGSHEIRLAPAEGGSPQVLWSFPAETETPPPFAIHGTRVAYTECDAEAGTCSLFLAEAGDTRAKRLLSRSDGMSYGNRPVWSPDGRHLAVEVETSRPADDGVDVLVVEISESGDVVGEPRLLPMDGGPRFWWSLQWLPDGEHFLIVGVDEGVVDTDVWLVSTDSTVPPVAVTADLQESVWNFFLSPDGRYIALESDMPRGASIWRVDLGDVLPGPER
jgi:Tol biopolymer transport system component